MAALVRWAGRHPGWWLLVYLVVTGVMYQTAARAPLYDPFAIAPSALDDAIPIVGWTAYPYMTYFALMPSFVWLARAHPRAGALLVAAGLCVVGNLTINTLVPTELARPLTVAETGGGLLAMVVDGDTPRVVLPSGHVALPLALALLSLRHGVGPRWLYPTWTVVMSAVVLTTKQHVVVDVLGGWAWGTIGPLVMERAVGLRRGR
ncbi:MAG: phosphatase PAP2 family protein [Deltaproteobacteria bacterium]|nr:phosphatase PAP2 family protein [Deltaproteobacteria bacterium]